MYIIRFGNYLFTVVNPSYHFDVYKKYLESLPRICRGWVEVSNFNTVIQSC